MPADKDAAKRRRQARNRQERENRQARTDGAKRAASRPSRTATETPTTSARSAKGAKGTTSLAKTPARAPAASGGILGKLFPPRPEPAEAGTDGRPSRAARSPRPPSEVVEVDAVDGPRGLLVRLTAQPGGRAIVLALLVSVVFSVTLLFFPILPSTDLAGYGATVARAQVESVDGDEDAVDDALADVQTASLGSVRGVEYAPPGLYIVLLISLVPTVIGAFAARSLTRPTRSRTLMMCAIAGVLFFVTNPGVGLYYVLGVIALGFGAYQSSKADKAALAASA